MKTRLLPTLIAVILLCSVSYGQDAPLQLIEQPKPELPKNHGTLDVQDSIIVRVEFLATGEIGKVLELKKSSIADLNQLVLVTAQKIKFVPKKVSGTPVSSVGIVQYVYSWEFGWKAPTLIDEGKESAVALDDKANLIITKAIQTLGGEKYLQIKTQVGRGTFSVLRDGGLASYQSFVDVLVYPDKERTDFKGRGSRAVQVNTGSTGWVYDGDQDLIKVQNEKQIADFKQSIRTSLDNLLRGHWKGDAELSYIGKRPATLGKRNDVVKLTYKDGFAVEFEFAAEDGLPQKALYKHTDAAGEEVKEEDRFAQFIDTGGVKTPLVIDRWTNGKQSSRINYETVEFNRTVPDSIFAKPPNPKDAKKDLKF
jgi:hypothetical protein